MMVLEMEKVSHVLQEKYMNLKLGERGAIVSIVAYVLLSGLKLLIGYLTDSMALRADGFNNVTDVVTSVAVLIGLKISRHPADSDHPYGHWRSETIASLFASFVMMFVGVQVLYGGLSSIIGGEQKSPDIIAAYTALFSGAVMYAVYRYNRRLAARTNSSSLEAASKDNLSDAWVSFGAAFGIFGAQFALPWLDALAAFVVGLLICRTAWIIFKESAFNLSDGFDEKKINDYKNTVLAIDGVDRVRDIKARNYGNNTIVDVVITVDTRFKIEDAHNISTRVERALKEKYAIFDVNVHVEPDQRSSASD